MDASGKPGYIVSSAAHAALLVLALISFSHSPKFDGAQDTIPIDLVSNQDFNQIVRGDKSAKQVQPKQRADKVADTVESKPKPPIADAKRDVPTPPPPLKQVADPGLADKVEPQKPPVKAAAAPPPPAKPVPLPPVAAQDAEQVESPKKAKDTAKKEVAKQPELKLDQIAKLLAQDKPKSGDNSKDPARKFSADDIARLLSREPAQRKAATGKELQQLASLGSPTANAAKMSPSLEAKMDGWFQDKFQGCWTQPISLPQGPKYVPEIRVPLNLDGSLAADPTLLNPPSDTAWQPLADSAVRAVHTCDPLPVPDIFKPYYEEWRDRVVRFEDVDAEPQVAPN